MYDNLSVEERKKADSVIELTKRMFFSKFILKERKRQRKEKKNLPQSPSDKEKEKIKEKVEKTTPTAAGAKPILDEDQLKFWNECAIYINNPYDEEMVRNFFHYWAEKDKKTGKMLWQTKRTWNTAFRLISWSKKSFTMRDEAASIDLNKRKQREAQQGGVQQKTKSVGIFRTHEPSKQEVKIARIEKSKDEYEEYLKTHPNSRLEKYRGQF